MSNDIDKLNRLRVNAGKTELKSWKASQAKLAEAIASLEAAGFTDTLPGADINAAPITDDPEVAKNLPVEEPKQEEEPEKPKGPPVVKVEKVGLARGLDSDDFAKNCRQRVRDAREKDRKDERESKKETKKAAKIAGQVDEKRDPEKAQRQKDKIKAKQEARAAKPTKEKNADVLTAAELAREVDMDPKIARAKLRRHAEKIKKFYPKWGGIGDWEFPKAVAPEIRKILSGEK